MVGMKRPLDLGKVLRDAAFGVTMLLSIAYISVLWLSIPDYQSSGGIALWHSGFAESLVRAATPFQYPPHLAFPQGAPIVFGASVSYLQYLLMFLFELDSIVSYSIVGSLFAAVALLGCYLCARNLGVGRWLSVALSITFLSQTFFAVHIMGYGATGFGFVLLPAFCALFQALMKHAVTHLAIALRLALMTLIMTFFAFLDGYAFIMVLACGTAIVAGFLISEHRSWRRHLVNAGILATATGIAYVAYTTYMPSIGLPGYPLSMFAALSVHLPSLVWPTTGYSMVFDHLGLSENRPGNLFIGAGLGNHETVFLSFTSMLLALVSLFLDLPRTWKLIGLLLIVGGLIMAIGPVLAESNGVIKDSQLTTAERAPILKMPTYFLYMSAPGLDQMRATYRWIAVVKLGLWILVCLCCARLAARFAFGSILALGLTALIALESSALPNRQWLLGRGQYEMAYAMQHDLTTDINDNVPAGSKLLVLPIANDFLIHSVAARAGVYTYNVAGDKNLLIAEAGRPILVDQIVRGGSCLVNNLRLAAQDGLIDFLAIRTFDSDRRTRGWIWPPTIPEIDDNRRVASELSHAIPESLIVKGDYFWFVDARRIDAEAAPTSCAGR